MVVSFVIPYPEFPIDVSYIFLKLQCVIFISIIAVLRDQDHMCLSNKRDNFFLNNFVSYNL